MQNKKNGTHDEKGYYVPGSELIPIPYHSLQQVRKLRAEHHEREVHHAMQLARVIKLA